MYNKFIYILTFFPFISGCVRNLCTGQAASEHSQGAQVRNN